MYGDVWFRRAMWTLFLAAVAGGLFYFVQKMRPDVEVPAGNVTVVPKPPTKPKVVPREIEIIPDPPKKAPKEAVLPAKPKEGQKEALAPPNPLRHIVGQRVWAAGGWPLGTVESVSKDGTEIRVISHGWFWTSGLRVVRSDEAEGCTGGICLKISWEQFVSRPDISKSR